MHYLHEMVCIYYPLQITKCGECNIQCNIGMYLCCIHASIMYIAFFYLFITYLYLVYISVSVMHHSSSFLCMCIDAVSHMNYYFSDTRCVQCDLVVSVNIAVYLSFTCQHHNTIAVWVLCRTPQLQWYFQRFVCVLLF